MTILLLYFLSIIWMIPGINLKFFLISADPYGIPRDVHIFPHENASRFDLWINLYGGAILRP
jgi:hypothetical protein